MSFIEKTLLPDAGVSILQCFDDTVQLAKEQRLQLRLRPEPGNADAEDISAGENAAIIGGLTPRRQVDVNILYILLQFLRQSNGPQIGQGELELRSPQYR